MIGFKGKRTSALKDVFISIKKTNKQITGEGGGEHPYVGDGRMTTRERAEKRVVVHYYFEGLENDGAHRPYVKLLVQ